MSLIIRKMQIKTAIRSRFMLTRLAEIQKANKTVEEDAELRVLTEVVGVRHRDPLWENKSKSLFG